MRARLTLYYHDAPARQVYLDAERNYVLGRDPVSDIVIDSPEASRRHAKMTFGSGHWLIEDLGSKNGVALDGAAVISVALKEDGWISLGELLVKFELRTDAQAEADEQNQRRRYETSMELRRALSPSTGVEPLLKKLLSSTLQLVGMERGFAMLARHDGDMEVICAIGAEGNDPNAFRGSVGAINHALDARHSVVSMDVQQFAPLAERPSIAAGNIRALVCLPMNILDRVIGMIYADSQEVGKVLTDLDMDILEGLISHATTALAVAQLDREIVDINSILSRGEVNIARLSRWQESLPGYKHPVSTGTAIAPGDTARLTWSRVAAGSR